MGKNKELRALIKLTGSVDPKLQVAMAKAAAESARTAGKIGKQWSAFGQKMKSGVAGLLKGLGVGLLAAATAATVAFGAMGAAGLEYASDLGEVQNVVDKTFAQSASVIDDFASRSLEAYGLTTLEAKNYSSTVGAMLKSMGFASEETLVMSQNLTALAGDMASFYNLTGEEAFQKIRAGISGETEPLKQLGINMSVANLEAYALSQGIQKAYGQMGQAEQAALRYNYLLSATADAQGDFADTSDSFANQQKLMRANLQQTSGEIMANMMPALAAGMKEVNGFIQGLDTQAIGQFAGQLAQMAVEFLPLVMDLMPEFGGLLMMLLPPLMEIGQAVVPIVVEVMQALMGAIEPILPVVMDFIEAMIPPLMEFYTAISPLVESLGDLFSVVLAPALEAVLYYLEPALKIFTGIAEVADQVVSFFAKLLGGDSAQKGMAWLMKAIGIGAATGGAILPEFANGGFSSRPAIFGEAGLEAAIPIRPGNPRSLSLLDRTAQLLGVRNTYSTDDSERKIEFTYAPVIHADGDASRFETMLRRGYAEMRKMIAEFFEDRGRLAWE